jgi:hypothetical protein
MACSRSGTSAGWRRDPRGNTHCAIQSFSFADIAYGVQYHMEPTECTLREWGQIPEYRESLEHIAGTDGSRRLEQQTIERIDDFRHYSKIVHRNLLKIVKTDAPQVELASSRLDTELTTLDLHYEQLVSDRH